MSRSLVALLALVPAAALLLGPDADARDSFPEGEVQFRPECFGGYEEEEAIAAAPMSTGGSVARAPTRSPSIRISAGTAWNRSWTSVDGGERGCSCW